MARGKQKQKKQPPRSELDELEAASGSDDEAGLLAMGPAGGGAGSSDPDEADVYGLDASEDSSQEDEGEEEDDEELLEEALLHGGRQAELAKQARYLEQKLKLQRGEDDDDDEEEEGEPAPGLKDKLWGANKRAYYQEGDDEAASDEEALQAEEEEARALQAAAAAGLADEDFGLPGSAAAAAGSGGAKRGAGGVQVESVAKDLDTLTAEQLSAVMADAPELLSLLDELTTCLAEVRGRIGPLLREVSSGGLATSAGLSYLEAKHLLLLQYVMCIVAYLMLKAEGRPVQDHPVISRLVQLRAYIEKIRPIDRQLAYQVDKLLRATAAAQADAEAAGGGAGSAEEAAAAAGPAGGGDDDALRYRPNPGSLIPKVPLLGDETAAAGVYRPPKLNPVAMEEDRALSNKEARRIREAQRRAQRSAVMRELASELAGAPDEVRDELPGMDTAAAVAARHRLEARAAAEEDLMLRVPLSKQEAKRLKAQRRAGLSGGGLTDFADDVADLVAASAAADGAAGSGLSQLFGKHRLSQQYGADLAAQQQAQLRSGDADIAPRKPLHERRAAFDAVAARRAAEADDAQASRPAKRLAAEEDDFYAAAKAGRASTKAAKRAKHEVPQLEPPLPDREAVGQRPISYEIQKNRGLTPHRRKDLKNPRKKHRVKFAKAVVRRKGQVQGVQQVPASARGYAGEATGIKARVSKSTKF